MRLLYKLLVVVALPAALIWAVGYYATDTSKESLFNAIQDRTDSQARALMDEIDRVIQRHLAIWQAYGTGELVQRTLRESNEELQAHDNVEGLIEERDRIWKSTEPGVPSELADRLSQNALSRDLSSLLEKLNSVNSGTVYGEVFSDQLARY